jgi:hypothetical protein
MFPLVAFILLFAPAHQQSTPASQQAPSNMKTQQAQAESGLENPWDVRNIIETIQKETDHLRPILAELNPQQWYDQKDAPSTYISEWHTAQKQLDEIALSTRLLSERTDSLPLALDEYFRLEALDVTSRTLQEGARKYAVRGVADQLDQFIARNFNNRERLRDYLKDLAANQEQDFKIADEEAQRCRGMISQEPASNLKKPRKH